MTTLKKQKIVDGFVNKKKKVKRETCRHNRYLVAFANKKDRCVCFRERELECE